MSVPQLHDFTCASCGGCVSGILGQCCSLDDEGQFRIAIDCPGCESPLDIVIEPVLTENPGVDIQVETR